MIPRSVHLETLGWRAVEQREQSGLWQDAEGDFLSLVRIQKPLDLPQLRDEEAVRRRCEAMAEDIASSLVESVVLDHGEGRSVLFVCRRIERSALVFTGVLIVPTPAGEWMWEMVAKGQPVTGDLRYLCDDCRCPAHPLARVRGEMRKLLRVRLDAPA
jgi:hypothetical protein